MLTVVEIPDNITDLVTSCNIKYFNSLKGLTPLPYLCAESPMSGQEFTESFDQLSGLAPGMSNMTSFKELLSRSFGLFLTFTRTNISPMEERLPDFHVRFREHET